MTYPSVRLRRLRQSPTLRNLVAETHLRADHLVYPMFVVEGRNQNRPIPSMPGISQLSIDNMLIEAHKALKLGVKSLMLFGVPDEKDTEASHAHFEDGIVQQAIRQLKANFGQDVLVMADTCLCEYTSHGHCGMILDGQVVNDPSVDILAKVAVSQAQAGADMVCPSDMMDGRVQGIRWALDDAGFEELPIMSYAVKFASALYAPFRDAAASAPAFGDRKTYQMDFRNRRESLLEVEQDVIEGADILMIKPALSSLDIVREVRDMVSQPIAVYNVSGEYSMVKAAAQAGFIDERRVVLELTTAMRRAGADIIVTYHALDIAHWLANPSI